MTFREQVIITLLDKALIGGLLLAGGYGLNRALEKFRSDNTRDNDRERLRSQKELDYLERQLSEFYYPIYVRLHIDGATWERLLDRKHGNNDLGSKIGREIEKSVLLPNHEAIVSIIQSKIHLAESDQAAFDAMLKYVRHVAVYRALRTGGFTDRDPLDVGEPWPFELLPIIEQTTAQLQWKYDQLLMPSENAETKAPATPLVLRQVEGLG
jgi:hypothetical protein